LINLKLSYPPTVNTYWKPTLRGKFGGVSIRLSERGRKYKAQAYLEMAEQHIQRGLQGRVELLIDVYPPDRRKRDLDNVLKPLLDVLEDYGVFDDDEQIDILHVRRRGVGGYVIIHVEEIADENSLNT
jgi:crossover junction endodeoxyribonuclease RusA